MIPAVLIVPALLSPGGAPGAAAAPAEPPPPADVDPGPSAYSCLAVLPGGAVGCLYERDDYRRIAFVRTAPE